MSKQTIKSLLFAALCGGLLHAGNGTLTDDAHVISGNASINYGNAGTMNVAGSNPALLRFDLSTLPAGISSSMVAKGTLTVFANTILAGGTLAAAPLIGPWLEGTVTYNTMPAAGPADGAGSGERTSQFVAIDVTAMFRGWLDDAASNCGIQLSAGGGGNFVLDSKESTTTGHEARLVMDLRGPRASCSSKT